MWSASYRRRSPASASYPLLVLVLVVAVTTVAAAPTRCEPAAPATKVAVTFDDLPRQGETPETVSREQIVKRIIAALQSHHLTQVYGFVNAVKVDAEPSLRGVLDLWMRAGFRVGNHSFSHPSLDQATAEAFDSDVDDDAALLKSVSPHANWKWFRYPFLQEGNTLAKRDEVRAHLAERGYKVAEVTVDFEDWAWDSPYVRCLKVGDTAALRWLETSYVENAVIQLRHAVARSQVMFHRDIPHILLLHVGAFDSLMLEKLLGRLEVEGVRFVSLPTATADPVYAIDPHVASSGGRNFLSLLLKHFDKPDPEVAPLPMAKLASLCQ
jgi:peptidoglycan/xylan/chitin deacetylase (PgdA/CDA1 family)